MVKCVRCISCGSCVKGSCLEPLEDVWLYIRKYEDGTVKYFLCNEPDETPLPTLDRLAAMRWSIEQCFQECKSYLGMTHYETRTWSGWHRHMLLVMVAHLFVCVLRHLLQKIYLTLPMLKRMISSALSLSPDWNRTICIIRYHIIHNAAAFRSRCNAIP